MPLLIEDDPTADQVAKLAEETGGIKSEAAWHAVRVELIWLAPEKPLRERLVQIRVRSAFATHCQGVG